MEYSLEIYVKYTYLDSRLLRLLPESVESIYETVLKTTSPVYVYENIPFRNFLEIDSVKTGESIRFHLKEGWRPELSETDGEISLGIPKILGVAGITLYLLLSGIQKVVGIQNELLDTKLKEIDLKTKQYELRKKWKMVKILRKKSRDHILLRIQQLIF